jgi:hypothetical protein
MPENYIEVIVRKLDEILPGCDTDTLYPYALLALTVGNGCTSEHVHDAWAAWRAATHPDHPSLLPYDQLTPEVRALDSKYAAAIREVAAAATADAPTFEWRIINARRHLGDALRELTSAGRGDYTGDSPTDRQYEALRDGICQIHIARDALAPGTHRHHAEAKKG